MPKLRRSSSAFRAAYSAHFASGPVPPPRPSVPMPRWHLARSLTLHAKMPLWSHEQASTATVRPLERTKGVRDVETVFGARW